jgi:hypothetical protein
MSGLTIAQYITRDQLRALPDTLFVFGDNMRERGLGGQAREMRGEPNAVGIPTKWAPSNAAIGFFCDSDLPACKGLIDQRFTKLRGHLSKGGEVVWPEAGIGTGLADLKSRAPRIWEYIEIQRAELFALYWTAAFSPPDANSGAK